MEIQFNQVMSMCEVLMDFDFSRVTKTMEATNWKWELPKLLNDEPGDDPPPDMMTNRVPTEIEMKRQVFQLMMKAFAEENTQYAGGFEAKFEWDNKEKTSYTISVQFISEDIKITNKA